METSSKIFQGFAFAGSCFGGCGLRARCIAGFVTILIGLLVCWLFVLVVLMLECLLGFFV